MHEPMTTQGPWIAARSPRTSGWQPPAWTLRLRLRWRSLDIDRLERELGDEFALLETAPLYQELRRLQRERDRLRRRLADRR